MQDQYSNYVIQHLLERGTTADRSAIISHVRGQLVSLSRHKFASNVIDKVILCASEEERRSLTDEILYDPANISIMLKDQVGFWSDKRLCNADNDTSVCQLLLTYVLL